uniref:Uncharacterized protein n=1 Tax=Anguilla anguilla TaxID=7936 RepID=A0A0E9WAH9_ANGAN
MKQNSHRPNNSHDFVSNCLQTKNSLPAASSLDPDKHVCCCRCFNKIKFHLFCKITAPAHVVELL